MIERELIHRWYELGVTAKRFLDFTCHLLDCMENDILREVERKVAIGGIFEKILAFDLLIKGFWTLPRKKRELLTEETNTDLIVVGTRGRSGFKRLLLGSVASDVVQYWLSSDKINMVARVNIFGSFRQDLLKSNTFGS
jgi:Universal stress protein family